MAVSLSSTIKAAVPRAWRRFLYRKLTKLAYRCADPEDREAFPSQRLSIELLRAAGFRSRACLDIGAYNGSWTRQFKSIFPEAQVLMLEAQEGKRAELEAVAAAFDSQVFYDIGVLGPEDGREVVFHEMGTGSSVFSEISQASRQSVPKISQTVDTVARRHVEVKAPFDFIKLDVQGYELEVLRGATETLKRCEVVFLEASLIPVNKGCPLIADVMAFLVERGFRLFDFCSQIRRPEGTLWQTDLLFLRADSKFLPKP